MTPAISCAGRAVSSSNLMSLVYAIIALILLALNSSSGSEIDRFRDGVKYFGASVEVGVPVARLGLTGSFSTSLASDSGSGGSNSNKKALYGLERLCLLRRLPLRYTTRTHNSYETINWQNLEAS